MVCQENGSLVAANYAEFVIKKDEGLGVQIQTFKHTLPGFSLDLVYVAGIRILPPMCHVLNLL
jgi:hypothetical protein